MAERIELIRTISDLKGKNQYKKTILEYTNQILNELPHDEEEFSFLLDYLQLSKEDFFNYLSGIEKADITFYDQTLTYLLSKKKSI